MSRLTDRQKANLRNRIEADAKAALSERIAQDMGFQHIEPARLEELKLLARERDRIVSCIVHHLLKHYTIRDRRR